MKTTTMKLSLLVALLAVFGFVLAGNLDPPGPPAPTMVTLQQIYDRVGAGVAGAAGTGQTGCFNASGTSINCAGTGQDGQYQAGVSVSPRFTDNGNGTVKDNLTGLIWLKSASCIGLQTWTNALAISNTLATGNVNCSLTDGSAAGAWRLPNVKELLSLIDFGHANSALPVGHPFTGVQTGGYWSSTSDVDAPSFAWNVPFGDGNLGLDVRTDTSYVWPVRGGQ